MAWIKKCDRCGVIYTPPKDIYFTASICTYDRTHNLLVEKDLCSECAESFEKWLYRDKEPGDENE